MNLTQAKRIVGSDLGKASKMPGYTIGISADHCNVGSKLAEIQGSVCAGCYAKKDNYQYPSVKVSHARRLDGLTDPDWPEAMATLIRKRCHAVRYFRWHDSGDVQNLDHLHAIVEVCQLTPEVRHWLPTHERALIKQFRAVFGPLPGNLEVRLSDAMVDAPAPRSKAWHTSGVTTDPDKATCRAFENNGKCGACRKCWDPTIERVVYLQH